ncbi:MAG: hypothetical protein Q9222_006572 [Ikaeria aurantiellina]
MIEASDFRAVVIANQKKLEKAEKKDAHRRIIRSIPSVDNAAKHKRLRSLRYTGTASWIMRENLYQEWYKATSSATFCCSGIPGCGKPVLTSSIVDALHLDSAVPKSSIAYYYCVYADQSTLQAERILGTLLKQFLVNGHIPLALERRIPHANGRIDYSLSTSDLIDLICLAIKQMSFAFVIIDGMDECESNTIKEISVLLRRLRNFDASTVRLFISCRQEDQMLRYLQGVPTIHVTSLALHQDIKTFVAGSVSSRILAGELKVRNPDLEKEIIDELVNKAHGMFLWVFFQLDDLCEAPSDALIRKTLQNLPNGLIETFERVLKKIWRNTIKRGTVRKMFMWIICAQRPLEIEELREAAGFEPNQKSWDYDMLPDADPIIEAEVVRKKSYLCKGLVIWNREDGIVSFAHHTVQQSLLSDSIGTPECNLKCRSREAEIYIGEMCITYLLFSDFETQIQVRPTKPQAEKFLDMPQAGPAHWIPGMLGVRASKLERPLRLLGSGFSSSAPEIDYPKYLGSTSGMQSSGPSPDIVNKYRLLQYVIDYWVFHTKGFDSSSASLTQKLQDLAMCKNLPFEFRPWGKNQHYGPYGCGHCEVTGATSIEAERLPFMSLLHYAAEIGHWPLMHPLLEEYCSHEAPIRTSAFEWDVQADRWLWPGSLLNQKRSSEKKTDQTVLIAIRNGHLSIVERLKLQHNGMKPENYFDLINVAASYGHESILYHLLDHMYSSDSFPGTFYHYAPIALALAAANGHEAVVKMLWHRSVPPDGKVDSFGETPTSAAAANGHLAIVHFLITNGAQLRGVGTTAFHRAAENRHVNVVRLLLQGEVSVAEDETLYLTKLLMARDRDGETPLHRVARNGHEEVVQVMLDCGPADDMFGLDADEHSALDHAVIGGNVEAVQILTKRIGMLVDASTLVLAAKDGHEGMLDFLIEKSMENPKNKFGKYTNNVLYRAIEEARADKLPEAAALLESYMDRMT